MLPGPFPDVRRVVDFLSTVEPAPSGSPDPDAWSPVDLAADGVLWAYPPTIAKHLFHETTPARLVLVGRILRALGWRPFTLPSVPSIRRAYFLDPSTVPTEAPNV